MQVLDMEEQEDGSAIVTLDMTPQEVGYFLELGVIEAIKRGANVTKEQLEALAQAEGKSSSEGDEHLQQTLNLRQPEEGTEEKGDTE